MNNIELKKEYLVEQAITFVSVGVFILTYTSDVGQTIFFIVVGISMCIFSILNVIIAKCFKRCVNKWFSISNGLKYFLLIFSSIALFMGVFETHSKGFFELRLIISFIWLCLVVFSMTLKIFQIISFLTRKALREDSKRILAYKTFVYIGILTVLTGLFLVINGIINPETVNVLETMNKWLYHPLTHFGIAIVCVFPILLLRPKDDP